ncbi:transposase [Cryobacterium frigoriphilum]|uniref:Transposase n=1 Tax=Cryobacterium frigoriphilum TaxID=1259150 RepID=A0A4R9A2A3_9MICO|nr:transposase [Cryobacterium frigoriphilum]TFD50786.1 transposase [Cryobacterium frigoriphilum]
MGFDVDWTHGADHMWASHRITVAEAMEALADVDALLFDPDPKSKSGVSARVLGFSPTAGAVVVVILVHRQDHPGGWWGANGWRAGPPDLRTYREGNPQ